MNNMGFDSAEVNNIPHTPGSVDGVKFDRRIIDLVTIDRNEEAVTQAVKRDNFFVMAGVPTPHDGGKGHNIIRIFRHESPEEVLAWLRENPEAVVKALKISPSPGYVEKVREFQGVLGRWLEAREPAKAPDPRVPLPGMVLHAIAERSAQAGEQSAEQRPDPAAEAKDQVRSFIKIISDQAIRAIGSEGKKGVLQISPMRGEKWGASERFHIEAVDRMADTAWGYAQAEQNVYVEARTLRAEQRKAGRGKVEDTEWVFAFVIDDDGYKDKGATLPEGIEPSLVVASSEKGRHLWIFLDKALRADEATKIGKLIKVVTGGDANTGVITQPYRVAGTPNYPTQRKIDAGRDPNPAPTFIVEHTGRLYTADELREVFKAPEKTAKEEPGSSQAHSTDPINEADVDADVLEIITNGVAEGDDRSVAFFNVVRDLKEDGYGVEQIYELLARHPNGIAKKFHDRGDLAKEVEHCWLKITMTYDDAGGEAGPSDKQLREMRKEAKRQRKAVIEEFNKEYMVAYDGGKAWILHDTYDHNLGRAIYDYMKPSDFALMHANRSVVTRIGDDGKKSKKKISQFWIENPERRQYKAVAFDPSTTVPKPGILNLWRGFDVKPEHGSWELMKGHILENICSNNREHFDYLMGWLATMFQRPADPGHVSVVLKGPQGAGKGILGHALRRMIGQHALHINSSKLLVAGHGAQGDGVAVGHSVGRPGPRAGGAERRP
jgi:hypothetical protein